MKNLRQFFLGMAATLSVASISSSALAATAERFEIASMRAVRSNLVATVDALQKKDIAKARDAFTDYDSAWNGIEVYVNTRDKVAYNAIELELQNKITKELNDPMADAAKILPDAQAILAKYDETVNKFAAMPPLNPLYDDVARLRIERSHLREVTPALKAGNLEKARKSYEAFDAGWDPIEDLIKARSQDDYVAIEAGMIHVEEALMPDKPDVAQVTQLVADITMHYNDALATVAKEAQTANAKP